VNSRAPSQAAAGVRLISFAAALRRAATAAGEDVVTVSPKPPPVTRPRSEFDRALDIAVVSGE